MSAWNGPFNVRIPHSAARTLKVLTNVNVKMDFTGLTQRAKVRGLALKFWSTELTSFNSVYDISFQHKKVICKTVGYRKS